MTSKVKTSLKASVKDGVFWAAMFSLAENYSVPFALYLGAGPLAIGILRSLPVLAASFVQIFAEFFVYFFKSCKKVVFWSVFFQAITLAAASFCVFLEGKTALYSFIFFAVLYACFGSLSSAPWFTLMGEYLPASSRGRFFGFRNRLIGISYFITGIAASLFLKFRGENSLAFFSLFFTAALARFACAYYITLMYESFRRFHIPKTFSGIIFPLFEKNENKNVSGVFYAVFILLFSTYLAAPYFSVYILKDLKFGYGKYIILSSIGQFLTWFLMKNWGIMLDRKGSVKVLCYSFFFIPLVSLLWIFSRNFYYLTAVEIFSGIAWGAYASGSTALVYEYLSAALRTRYNSFLIFLASAAQFSGSILGGLIYDYLDKIYAHPFLFLLALSTAGRFLALKIFWPLRSLRPDNLPQST
ncbi:MAG: MFS transporter [Elusimicrobia bacterium]|nr:MFS transporter [Elusimicrobiota bacterium]